MGKEPKNGFCYISVNKILKLLFSGFFRVAVAPTPFALQSAPNSDSYQVNSIGSNVMSSCFISNSSLFY